MKAKRLFKNDVIGVCAPSGCIKEKNINDLKDSEKLLNDMNIKVKYGDNLFANSLLYSASIEEKISDFNSLIRDKNIKAIAFAKGGNNANGILEYIDYNAIKNNPKIIFGFSDNTVLLNAIYKKTGLVTYHFTNYKGLFESNIDFNKKQFIDSFIYGYKGVVKQNSMWNVIRPGSATGKLIGGNLGSLVKILDTEYCPSFKNNILFLEDLAFEDCVEQVSSYLYKLKMSGVFDKISGLLLGNYQTQEDIEFEKIVLDVVKDYDFPIIKCNDFGHTDTNIVLPIGSKCTLDANKGELILNENTVL